jgi:hypothetical protein
MTPLSPSDRISPSVEALVSAIPAGADCLSESEAATLREIYSGAEDTDGKVNFSGVSTRERVRPGDMGSMDYRQ